MLQSQPNQRAPKGATGKHDEQGRKQESSRQAKVKSQAHGSAEVLMRTHLPEAMSNPSPRRRSHRGWPNPTVLPRRARQERRNRQPVSGRDERNP
eukprot:4085632-Alexandrium_andersonii.AAC.1